MQDIRVQFKKAQEEKRLVVNAAIPFPSTIVLSSRLTTILCVAL